MKQLSALTILQTGRNVFLTGAAGTGKTHVLRQYISYLRDHSIFPTIVAPTGIAASHLGGMTIHSCFGLGPFDEEPGDLSLKKSLDRPGVKKRLKHMNVLIVDEVSMLSPVLFSVMDRMFRMAKESDELFGGIQIIFSGDFFQLPPVARGQERRYVWQTSLWEELELVVCYLHEKYRQKDPALLELLQEIRRGEVSEDSMNHLRRRYRKHPEGKGIITKLYTHNADIDRINYEALKLLDTDEYVFQYESYGTKGAIEKLVNNSLMQAELRLKEGATVMFVKNSQDGKFVNGTLGTIVGFSEDRLPLVETKQGVIEAERMEWKEEDDKGKTVASVWQVPLRLAWAITVHKSQGMTLDAAEIDLSKTFEVGQGYVALSRLRRFEDLKLMGFNHVALQTAPELLEEDIRMQTFSESYEAELESEDEANISIRKKENIVRCGGYFDVSSRPDTSAQKTSSSTYEFTKQLVDERYTVESIAKRRGLTVQTIYKHLAEIRTLYPDVDMDYLKPLPQVMKEIEVAVLAIRSSGVPDHFSQDGSVKKKVLFEYLSGRVGYDEIALAGLFIE